jgi:hypothetical protein
VKITGARYDVVRLCGRTVRYDRLHKVVLEEHPALARFSRPYEA